MKFIIAVFKNVINPISAALMLLIGMLAAILSGVIEFFVLKDLFSRITLNGNEMELSFLPLVIVIVLEGSKLFLHFGNSAIKQNLPNDYENAQKFAETMNKIKICLIIFSFVCTVIFTCNFLYQNSSVVVKGAQEAAITEIDNRYDKEVENYTNRYWENIQRDVDSKKQEWVNASDELANLEPRLSPRVVYERYLEEKAALEKKVEEKYAEYQVSLERLNTNVYEDEYFQNGIAAIETERVNEKSAAIENAYELDGGDNEYIRTFLLFIFNSLLRKDTYPKVLYFIVALAISLVVAAILEAVIYFSQRLITMPSNELEKAFEADYEADSEIKTRIKFITRVVIGASISFFVFLVYGLLKEIAMNKFELIAGLICSLLTILMSFALPKFSYDKTTIAEKKLPKTNKAFNILGEFMATEGKTMIIKAILSFVCFIFLGILFEESIAEITVPAVGVAIGGAIGHVFHITPKAFNLSSV